MDSNRVAAQAARLQRRTRRILVGSGAMFVIWQVSYFTVSIGTQLPFAASISSRASGSSHGAQRC